MTRGRAAGVRALGALCALLWAAPVRASVPPAACGAADRPAEARGASSRRRQPPPDVAALAELARKALAAHDPSLLVATGWRVVVQLPGFEPTMPLARPQAAAVLRDYLEQGHEVEAVVRTVHEMDGGRAYVELLRRYRVAGTQEVRRQTLLLTYRQGREGWRVVEVRVY